MNYTLYNVTGSLINKPCRLSTINARNYEDAFVKCKAQLCKGIREQLGLSEGTKIAFTTPVQDESLGYGDRIRYTTCSIEDKDGFVIDTYEYAIGLD